MKQLRLFLLILFVMYLQVSAQNSEKRKLWDDFEKDFPGKNIVKWIPETNAPKRIIGNNIFLPERSIRIDNAAQHTGAFLNKYQYLFNFRGSELKSEDVVQFDSYYLVVFQQYYKNVEVMHAKLKVKVTPEGQITWINSQCHQDIQISEKPGISLNDAQNKALSHYDAKINESKEEGKLIIFRNPVTNNLNLCWNLKFINKQKSLYKVLLIDANTGKIISEGDPFIKEDINGNVKINTWNLPGMTGGSPDATPNCQDLIVNVTGVGSSNTDQNGNYSITVPSAGNYTVTSLLSGSHAYVNNYIGSDASFSGNASTSTDFNWTWQESAHYNEYFVFYYMNNAWHKFSTEVPGFSNNYWNANQMLGLANEGSDVNGSADGTEITITPDNHYGCSVYHEYSHNVIFKARNNQWLGFDPYNPPDYNTHTDGYAMDEGFADYFSCTFRNDPHRYASGRDLGTKMKYYPPGPPNDDAHEGHTRGQIIGGACWDLRNKSGMDVNYINGKVYQVIAGLGYLDTFGDFFDDLLLADDNDGNIFNGTPHDIQICDAFVNDHNIFGSYLAGTITANISTNQELNITLIDNVTLASNVTLTFNGNATITNNGAYGFKFTPGSSTGILVNGNLSVLGSEGNLFKFISTSASPSRTDWGGLYVDNGGSINLNYCEIADAVAGIQTEPVSGFSVQNSKIHHTNYHGILVNIPSGITANILNNRIYDNANCGIMSPSGNGSVNIRYNAIYKNYDFGAYVWSSQTDIENNTVFGNTNGIWVYRSGNAYIKNNIITENNLSGNGNQHRGIWSGTTSPTPQISYNDVWNNSGGNYYNCSAGTGDISQDPLFLNKNNDDYKINYNSPCINMGDPTSPLDPDGTRNDMGAFYCPQISGTISSNSTWSGAIDVIGTVTVNAGVTLTISSGTAVYFVNNTSLIVHGKIVANNATLQPVNGAVWNGIIVDGSLQSTLSDCSIKGCTTAMTVGGSTYWSPSVSRCTFEGTTNGIWIKESCNPSIYDSYIKAAGTHSTAVLATNNAGGFFNRCKLFGITFSDNGLKCDNSATPCFAYYQDARNIIDNSFYYRSIYVTGGYPALYNGKNSIPSRQYLYQYANSTGSPRDAQGNYWGGGAPNVTGQVNYTPYLTTIPNPIGPSWTLSKVERVNDGKDSLLTDELAEAWQVYFDRDFGRSKELSKNLFMSNSENELASEALFLQMKSALNEGTLQAEESNLLSLSKNSVIHASSKYESLRWLAKLAVYKGDFKKVEEYALAVPSSSKRGREILFDAAVEILERWGDVEKASGVLDKLTERYVDKETSEEKQLILDLYKNYISQVGSGIFKRGPIVSELAVNSMNLLNAYPNPFNPTTTIGYRLSTVSNVSLKVYDVLGREVAMLVGGMKEAGFNNATFDGSRFSSGVYFVRMTAMPQDGSPSYTKTMKMLMVK